MEVANTNHGKMAGLETVAGPFGRRSAAGWSRCAHSATCIPLITADGASSEASRLDMAKDCF